MSLNENRELARLGHNRRLGQHFLRDLNLTRRIARCAGDLDGRWVVEIGPGPGGLTRPLLESGAKGVIAIEKDPSYAQALQRWPDAASGRLRVLQADALEIDPHLLVQDIISKEGLNEEEQKVTIIANLPYNISTVLILKWTAFAQHYESLTLTVQKEVALRLQATSGSHYSRLSVAVGHVWRCRKLFDIDPQAFIPPPKVWSSVVHLVARGDDDGTDWNDLIIVAKAAFSQRRKMLRSSLSSLASRSSPDGNSTELCQSCGIDPSQRAEELSIDDYRRLARAWRASCPSTEENGTEESGTEESG